MMKFPFSNSKIEQVFADFPDEIQSGVYELRDLILATGEKLSAVDHIDECLRWGHPSYISPVGTALRVGAPKTGGFAIFAHCQSNVISNFAQAFGVDYQFDGNRAVLFKTMDDIQPDKLCLMIEHALTYKLKRD